MGVEAEAKADAELVACVKESTDPLVDTLLDLALVPTLALVSLHSLSHGVLDSLEPLPEASPDTAPSRTASPSAAVAVAALAFAFAFAAEAEAEASHAGSGTWLGMGTGTNPVSTLLGQGVDAVARNL